MLWRMRYISWWMRKEKEAFGRLKLAEFANEKAFGGSKFEAFPVSDRRESSSTQVQSTITKLSVN
jgi:hypothetical protein